MSYLNIIKIIIFTLLISISQPVFAQIAVLKSNLNDQIYSKYRFGNYQTYISKLKKTLNKTGIPYSVIEEKNIADINVDDYSIILVPYLLELSAKNISLIKNYTSSGGKLIIISPPKSNKNTQDLYKLIDVKLEEIKKIKHRKYANWVEKKISNNYLNPYSSLSLIKLLKNTKSLAVWDEIEKNEPAITYSDKGSLITWLWGIEANENFNIKSFQTLAKILDPKIKINESYLYNYQEFAWGINKIDKTNQKSHKSVDPVFIDLSRNTLNKIQEYNALSEIYLTLAKNSFQNKNYSQASNQRDLAEKYASDAYMLSAKTEKTEGRAIWFDRGTITSIKSQKEMGKIFDNIKKSGLNIVFFETLNAGFAVYPSALTEQNPLTIGRDPLKWAIKEAHKRNIELHSWVWVFAAGNDRHNPIIGKSKDYPGPILAKNKKWLLLGEKGNAKPLNQHEFWVDPSNKDGREHLILLMEEIAKKYDVDGIQLDYIRYPFQKKSNLMGFNSTSKYNFEKASGLKLTKLDARTLSLWNKWKEHNISSFVEEASVRLKNVKPNIKISAAVFGKSTYSRLNTIQQNWEEWSYNGWVDILSPMIYALDNDILRQNLICFNSNAKNKVMIYPGIAIKHLDNNEVINQLTTIKNHGFNGNTIFAAAYLNSQKINLLSFGPNRKNEVLIPSSNPLKSAQILLKEYRVLIKDYINLKNNNLAESIEMNELINKLDRFSEYLNDRDIGSSGAISAFNALKSANLNWVSSQFKGNENRCNAFNSYLLRIESLVYYYLSTKMR